MRTLAQRTHHGDRPVAEVDRESKTDFHSFVAVNPGPLRLAISDLTAITVAEHRYCCTEEHEDSSFGSDCPSMSQAEGAV